MLQTISKSSFAVGRGVQRRFASGGGGIGLYNVHDQLLQSAIPSHRSKMNQCAIIGVPMTDGQPYVGTDDGPNLLRKYGLVENLKALSWNVEDLGDLDLPKGDDDVHVENGNAKNAGSVGAGTQLLAQTVYDRLQNNKFPLILGGDHSIGIGSLAALLKHEPETGIIWVDAHADINTPWISESGNMHGMPVGLLFDTDKSSTIPGFEWLKDFPSLDPKQIVYIGLRDVDRAERQIILEKGIAAYTMHEIDRYGIGKVMDDCLNVHLKDRPLHMSYDIDAVDPVLAPATGTTVRGGLTFREAHYVAEAAASRLASAEIVELNPTLSNTEGVDNTVDLGLHLISSMMGKSII